MIRTVGIIGGVSPESTVVYYRLLNAAMRERFGGQHSAPVLIGALDYGEMVGFYHARDWSRFIDAVLAMGRRLEAGGAECLAISSNTTHIAADALVRESSVPVIHLLDALSDALKADGKRRPLLFGTGVVASADFYRDAFEERFEAGFDVPASEDQASIDRIIFQELVEGRVEPASRAVLDGIIEKHADCDSVILGCTELCLILDHTAPRPVYDTTAHHARAIFNAMTGL